MWKSLGELLKLLIAVSVVFCMASLGIFFLQLRSDTKNVSNQTVTTLQAIQSDVDKEVPRLNQTLDNLDSTVTDLRRTIQIAGGTLNIARDTLRKSQETNLEILKSVQELTAQGAPVLQQTQDTMASAQKTVEETQKTIEEFQPVLQQTQTTLTDLDIETKKLQPAADSLSVTMGHIDGITQDVQTEIHKFVHPPPKPWYSKYIIDPLKIGLKMLTIPLNY